MKTHLLVPAILLACASSVSEPAVKGQSTSQRVGGPCEGCEAIHESPVPFAQLPWLDTLPDFTSAGPKLVVEGTVFKQDGKTPAPDVVVYFYHTDQKGVYPKQDGAKGWAQRHGAIRGWIKTNSKGQYRILTLRPASYPGSRIPAHIHVTVKEPRINEYFIDDILFDDDTFLSQQERAHQRGRGGKGIVTLQNKNGMAYGKRDVVLGKNIPDYPTD